MTHKTLAFKAATGADTAMRAAQYLSKTYFGEANPLLIARGQDGEDRLAYAEAVNILTGIFSQLCGVVVYVNAVTAPGSIVSRG